MKKILFIVNVDWFFLSHRLPIALRALELGFSVTLACKITEHCEQLTEIGINVIDIPFSRSGGGVITEINTIVSIRNLIKDLNPDLIHCVTIKPVIYTGLALRTLKRDIPIVAAISGLGYVFAARTFRARLTLILVSFLYKIALGQKNKMIVFQNKSDAKTLASFVKLNACEQTIIRGSGADLTVYDYTPEKLDESVRVVMACRLLKEKGVYVYVEAARIVKKMDSNIRFILVGSPDAENPNTVVQSEIDDWIEEGIIEYLGHSTDIPSIFSKSNIVCLPSYYGEGLPKVLIEAAACGRAVVTTDHPGCRDAIEPDYSGVLVPIRDARSLANAIQDLIVNPNKRIAMGKAGRELAEKEFSIDKVVNKHIDIYSELLLRDS